MHSQPCGLWWRPASVAVLWSQQGHAGFHPLMLAMAMLPVQITALVWALGRSPCPRAGDQRLKVR